MRHWKLGLRRAQREIHSCHWGWGVGGSLWDKVEFLISKEQEQHVFCLLLTDYSDLVLGWTNTQSKSWQAESVWEWPNKSVFISFPAPLGWSFHRKAEQKARDCCTLKHPSGSFGSGLFLAIWLALRTSCSILCRWKLWDQNSRHRCRVGAVIRFPKPVVFLSKPCLSATIVSVYLGTGASSPSRAHSICRCCYEDRFTGNDWCGAWGRQFCIFSKGRPPECRPRHPGFSWDRWDFRVAPQTGDPLHKGR